MDKFFRSMFQMVDGTKEETKKGEGKRHKKRRRSRESKESTANQTSSIKDHKSDVVSHSSEDKHGKSKEHSLEEVETRDLNFCKDHNEKCVYFCKEWGKGLCNKCKQETHHATTHHLHLVNELSKFVIDEFYNKIDQTESIRQILKEKQGGLQIPERSFTFGLEMINHVFDTVIREIENEKLKIMENFRVLIEDHCRKKFEGKAMKLHKELDKCTSFLLTTIKALDDTYKESKHVEVCNEYPTISYMSKTMKKFEDSINKAEKFAVFCENDYQFVFHKNDFAKSLKEIIDQNVHFNLTTDQKDPKFQDLGKMDQSSIVYVGGNNPSELSIIHYNMDKMSRAEKKLIVPKDDKYFPISGYRSFCDTYKNLVYLFGGKTDGNFTTNRTYQLKQVSKEEGKEIEITKLDNMKSTRAYHGSCMIDYKSSKYIIAVGGQQSLKSMGFGHLKDSDTVSMSSSGFEVEIPRHCISECELYDIANNKWIELPSLCSKKSNTSVWVLENTTIVYCFGGWNGKNSVNSIERLNIAEFISADDLTNEGLSETGEETKAPASSKAEKSNSAGNKKVLKTTWTPIVVREAGMMSSAPNYRLFSAVNSIGCIALDSNCILLFGGKESILDGETDQCYMFYGANRVKAINPNDHLYEMQKWGQKLSMGDAFGNGSFHLQKDKALYALSDTWFIHYLDFVNENWELKKI